MSGPEFEPESFSPPSLEPQIYIVLQEIIICHKKETEKNQCIRQKTGSTEQSKGNKTVPEKVATTCTEDGQKQTTKTSVTI